jgi:hypothetical protein
MTFDSPHLLVSVYLTSVGLANHKYRLHHAADLTDPYFRVGRFLTGLASLRNIPWSSVSIHFDTQPSWQSLKPKISQSIQQIFPNCAPIESRLSNAAEWLTVASQFRDDDVVYLHTNDDHAFVAESHHEFLYLSAQLARHPELKLGAVTHFPEMIGMLARQSWGKWKSPRHRTIEVEYAIGTTLVRADFFREWWHPEKWTDNDVVVRPDNPLGKSVKFSRVRMIVSQREIFRHLDGYSHVGIDYPVPALRNIRRFDEELRSVVVQENWTTGYWPAPLLTFDRTGVDCYRTSSDEFSPRAEQFASAVAWVQSMWALRIFFCEGYAILRCNTRLSIWSRICVILVALMDWRIGRNLIDKVLDGPLLAVFTLLGRFSASATTTRNFIYYKGSIRTLSWRMFDNKR